MARSNKPGKKKRSTRLGAGGRPGGGPSRRAAGGKRSGGFERPRFEKKAGGARRRDVDVELEAEADAEEKQRALRTKDGTPMWAVQLRRENRVTERDQAKSEQKEIKREVRLKKKFGAKYLEAGKRQEQMEKVLDRKSSGQGILPKDLYPTISPDSRGVHRLLDKLHKVRLPMFKELRPILKALRGNKMGPQPHEFCTRTYNQMRISDLEAMSIARAFQREPHLIHRKAEVLRRAEEESMHMKKSGRRQNFTCPLLEGEKCLVHQSAKPFGCLCWNGKEKPSQAGWKALHVRDHLNSRIIDRDWQLKPIPLMLMEYLDGEKLESVRVAVATRKQRKQREERSGSSQRGVRGSERDPVKRRENRHEDRFEERAESKRRNKTKKNQRRAAKRSAAKNSTAKNSTAKNSTGRKPSAKKRGRR